MQLNGWQRLWTFLTVSWVSLWVAMIVWVYFEGSFTAFSENPVRIIFVIVAPPVLIYGVGLAAAWIRDGFREQS